MCCCLLWMATYSCSKCMMTASDETTPPKFPQFRRQMEKPSPQGCTAGLSAVDAAAAGGAA